MGSIKISRQWSQHWNEAYLHLMQELGDFYLVTKPRKRRTKSLQYKFKLDRVYSLPDPCKEHGCELMMCEFCKVQGYEHFEHVNYVGYSNCLNNLKYNNPVVCENCHGKYGCGGSC